MEKIFFEKVGARLKQARESNHITLEEAGNRVGVHKSTVLRWENGETEKIKLPIIESLATFYNVNPVWLMGYDVPMKSDKYVTSEQWQDIDELGNPIAHIPLVGAVKAGYNYLAQENWIGTVDVEKSLVGDGKDYFALKIKGDSMAPAFVEDDIVIIKKQNDCENNEFAVVIINGDEGTLKKIKKTDNGIILQPLNPAYGPVMYTKEEMETIPIIIVGVVKQLKREF